LLHQLCAVLCLDGLGGNAAEELLIKVLAGSVGLLAADQQSLRVLTGVGTNDEVLGYIHQTAGQVSGASCSQSGVSRTLSGRVRGDEILKWGEPFLETGEYRNLHG